ncbi:Exocyst complex component EXO70B1 [Linum perenne]
MSIGDIQRLEWDALESKIRRWIRAAKVCVRILFVSEKKLCEQIFEGVGSSVDDACFVETVKGPAVQLFNFAEAVSISRRSPEKMFKILDLHDALVDLMPDIESVFGSKSADSIRVQAAEILSRLAEAARGILSEFENVVLREPSKVPVPGGQDQEMEFAELDGKPPLALHLIWIIVILQFNLDGKSKLYKDTSLAHLRELESTPETREGWVWRSVAELVVVGDGSAVDGRRDKGGWKWLAAGGRRRNCPIHFQYVEVLLDIVSGLGVPHVEDLLWALWLWLSYEHRVTLAYSHEHQMDDLADCLSRAAEQHMEWNILLVVCNREEEHDNHLRYNDVGTAP